MNNYFTYSVLQYKHSLALGEILNVGILFYFPIENKFEVVTAGGHRAKAIYPDFDNSLYQVYLKSILSKIKEKVNLFSEFPSQSNLSDYIHKFILAQDAAGLIFREPVHVKNVFNSNQRVIDEYSKLLLPGINIEKPVTVVKHNEQFISKTFNGYLLGKDSTISEKIKKNQTVKLKASTVKFEYVWNHNYVKPLSFDLTDESSIQTKSAIIHSQLIQLKDFAIKNKVSFDLLIAKPQEPDLESEYNNALDLIDSVKTSKKLITQEKWTEYFESTFEHLVHN